MRKPCCDKQDTNKGAWSKQEDMKLIDHIRKNGEGCWRTLPKAAGLLRCGKSCRLRWINYLRPDLKRGNFAEDEEDLIIKLHALLGNRWSLIAGRLPGRTDNEVKNYWNSHLRRKLINMGIDPNNHRPTTTNILRRPPPSHHHHHHHQNPQTVGSATTLVSDLKSDAPANNNDEPVRSDGDHDINCDQVSDGTSCFEDDSSCGLPDLNLGLKICTAAPFSDSSIPHDHNLTENPSHHDVNDEPKMSFTKSSSEFDSSTTLPLFS